MLKKRFDNLAVLVCAALAVIMTACGTTSEMPLIDDAYYWPEKISEAPAPPISTELVQPAPKSNMEYVTIQDTTVTLRIKK